jgi:hypothetical protein
MPSRFWSLLRGAQATSVRNELELISIHIPKTAGTSFRNTLCEVYGQKEVVRLDIGLVRKETRIREQLYEAPDLPPETRVLHGHFSYPLLVQRFDVSSALPVITWLRDPVDRVISNYFYLAKRLREELDEERKGLHILKKMQRSLREYALYEPSQNRMSKFLEGLSLQDLFFVGLVEHYEEDVASLARKLSWQHTPVFYHNRTGSNRPDVSEEDRAFIRSLNAQDVALYEAAQSLRAQGKWSA